MIEFGPELLPLLFFGPGIVAFLPFWWIAVLLWWLFSSLDECCG